MGKKILTIQDFEILLYSLRFIFNTQINDSQENVQDNTNQNNTLI